VTFLPIAVRELRVAARKRSTFWLRVVAALLAVVISVAAMIIQAASGAGTAQAGKVLFEILTWMAVAGALSAGLFFTSDCLSEEKREGTLGFLFLLRCRRRQTGGNFLALLFCIPRPVPDPRRDLADGRCGRG